MFVLVFVDTKGYLYHNTVPCKLMFFTIEWQSDDPSMLLLYEKVQVAMSHLNAGMQAPALGLVKCSRRLS